MSHRLRLVVMLLLTLHEVHAFRSSHSESLSCRAWKGVGVASLPGVKWFGSEHWATRETRASSGTDGEGYRSLKGVSPGTKRGAGWRRSPAQQHEGPALRNPMVRETRLERPSPRRALSDCSLLFFT